MLWAPGFYKCHCTWLIFASNCFEFQDLKQRGFRWQEVKSWVGMALIAAGSEHLWVPCAMLGPRGWFLVHEKLCSPGQRMYWRLSSNSPLSGPLYFATAFSLLCQIGFSSLQLSSVLWWPDAGHSLKFPMSTCSAAWCSWTFLASSAHPSSLSPLLDFLSTDSDYLLVLLPPLFSHPTLVLSASSLSLSTKIQNLSSARHHTVKASIGSLPSLL